MTVWRLIPGDCIEVMATFPDSSIDAIVTDPPYGLGFMGREWDALPPGLPWAQECLRVLKPGGHLLAFGGTRTYHRLACAIEDAGFEVRDCLAWLYGSGFPKSLDVSKAIDKAAGAEREIVRPPRGIGGRNPEAHAPHENYGGLSGRWAASETAPATPDAERWQGWGTALKPAHEPIVMARKPLGGTVAANVLAHGTGALNVDGCRIGFSDTEPYDIETKARPNTCGDPHEGAVMNRPGTPTVNVHDAGRWPANVLLDPEAAAMLDEQTGDVRSAGEYVKGSRGGPNDFQGPASINIDGLTAAQYADSGGASRFFYVAKASSAERNAGLDGFTARRVNRYSAKGQGPLPQQTPTEGVIERNVHPTVKPIDVMRWLCRLVTPSGGTVLDPFTGSGTTGIAALREGFSFIGIEREAEYVDLARARIVGDAPLINSVLEAA